ncbi:acyl-CoA thioester hydrolase [Lachnospiraceae bacterium]|nr:acyl-CoA thioester hydrolase [Lachnospiraceae bacterium]
MEEKQTFIYRRSANYYETDQMSIIHHSNYVRWMEEARMAWMASLGVDYAEMERLGVISPVISVDVKYKKPVLYGETVDIAVTVKKYNGVKLSLGYEMKNVETGEVTTIGETSHGFLKENKIISLQKELPEMHSMLEEHN